MGKVVCMTITTRSASEADGVVVGTIDRTTLPSLTRGALAPP